MGESWSQGGEEGSGCKQHSLVDGSSWQDECGPLRAGKLEG